MRNPNVLAVLFASQLSQQYNQWLYRLQQIPFLGKYLSDKWYGLVRYKSLLTLVMLGFTLVKRLFVSLLYFLCLFGGLAILTEHRQSMPYFMHGILTNSPFVLFQNVLVVWHLVSFSLFQSKLLTETDEQLWLATRLFQLPARQYLLFREQVEALTKALVMSLSLGFLFQQFSWWQGLYFSILTVGCRLFLRSTLLYLYRLTRPKMATWVNGVIGLGVITLLAGMTYWFWFGALSVPFFFSPAALGLGLALWAVAGLVLWTFPRLELVVRRLVLMTDFLAYQDTLSSIDFLEVEVKTEDLTLSEADEQVRGHGVAYLNALFVKRFRGVITSRVRIVVGVIMVLTLIVHVVAYVKSDSALYSSQQFWQLVSFSFYTGFLAYLGDYLMRLSFYHMDRPLLHYRFYRQKKTILALLKARFLWSLKLNAPIFLALLGLFFSIYTTMFVWHWQEAGLLFLGLCLGLCFFSLHHLYLYFFFQPFTQGMKTKGMAYKIAYYTTLVVCHQLSHLNRFGILLLMGVIVLYLPLGYLAVKRLAPKTFVLK